MIVRQAKTFFSGKLIAFQAFKPAKTSATAPTYVRSQHRYVYHNETAEKRFHKDVIHQLKFDLHFGHYSSTPA